MPPRKNKSGEFKCPYCNVNFLSKRGRSQHIASTTKCRRRESLWLNHRTTAPTLAASYLGLAGVLAPPLSRNYAHLPGRTVGVLGNTAAPPASVLFPNASISPANGSDVQDNSVEMENDIVVALPDEEEDVAPSRGDAGPIVFTGIHDNWAKYAEIASRNYYCGFKHEMVSTFNNTR